MSRRVRGGQGAGGGLLAVGTILLLIGIFAVIQPLWIVGAVMMGIGLLITIISARGARRQVEEVPEQDMQMSQMQGQNQNWQHQNNNMMPTSRSPTRSSPTRNCQIALVAVQ